MKITAIETLRAQEFANVLWAHVHTDEGTIGLGETFYTAAAVFERSDRTVRKSET